MGSFYVNFTTRGPGRDAVANSLRSAKRKAFVAPTRDGLTVFFDEVADMQSEEMIKDLSERISKELDTPLLAVRNHDDDVLCYWLYEAGRMTDKNNSCREYFIDDDTTPAGGDAKKLCAAFGASGKTKQVDRVLRNEECYFALFRHQELAALLNFPWPYVSMGYRSIEGCIQTRWIPDGESKKDLIALDERLG